MRVRSAVTTLAVLAGVGAVGVAVVRGTGPLPDPEGCTALVEGHHVALDTEQAENAALIAAIGVHRDLPARAVSIALATAYQESKMINVEHGDRDSLGLFQQRPSQGWGTEAQILDPVHATNAFYDALVKIDGYESMRITEAAQKVQRSAYPEAYEDHAEDGRALFTVAVGLLITLFVSGLIEGFVTPSNLPWPVKIGIGVLALAAFLVYMLVVGRRAVRLGASGDLDEFEAGARRIVAG